MGEGPGDVGSGSGNASRDLLFHLAAVFASAAAAAAMSAAVLLGLKELLTIVLAVVAAIGLIVVLVQFIRAPVGDKASWRRWMTIVVGTAFIGIVGVALLFNKAPDLYPVTGNVTLDATRFSAIATTRAAVLASVVGVAAVGTLVVNAVGARIAVRNLELGQETLVSTQEASRESADAARRNIELTRSSQLIERYAGAVELLGKTGDASAIGGIYALERLGKDAREEYNTTVVEVLAAYVRSEASLAENEVAGAQHLSALVSGESAGSSIESPKDAKISWGVRVALSVLTRISEPPPVPPPSSSGAELIEEFTTRVFRTGAAVDLRRVNLRRLALTAADLRRADLRGADLSGAKLVRADLRYAKLEGVDFTGADLSFASFIGAELSGVRFDGANLTDAVFGARDGRLGSAVIVGSHFADARLHRANLRGVNLSGARGLVQQQIDSAEGDSRTSGLNGLSRPPSWST
ncbi:pentapeptide repeat-containing protein [Actinomycetospora sp. CA-053990]|uniref:pentapeptide repeat-containing protein n=1 Tax=Actinomycetospora sp. CA-053990 TaxID=3239891 RepID=UPI003D8AD01E